MKLTPLFDRVVLKQLVAEETTKSGIVLPGQAKEKPQQAEVIAVGPVIACAASCMEGKYRLSVGARPSKALLLLDEEGILSDRLTESSIKTFSVFAENKISTGSNVRAGAEYRKRLIGVLSQRLFKKIMEVDNHGKGN